MYRLFYYTVVFSAFLYSLYIFSEVKEMEREQKEKESIEKLYKPLLTKNNITHLQKAPLI